MDILIPKLLTLFFVWVSKLIYGLVLFVNTANFVEQVNNCIVACVHVDEENGWEKEPLYTFPFGDIYYGLLTSIKYRAFCILTNYMESFEGGEFKEKGCHCLLGSHDDCRNVSHG